MFRKLSEALTSKERNEIAVAEGDGAIMSDVMFRKVDNDMEISWWTDQEDEGRMFQNRYGFKRFHVANMNH